MPTLDKMTAITDLREVWKHEVHDFTRWLSEEENLKELSDAVGIDIALQERESSVGSFSADMLAIEEGTGRKIIIENQLSATDHDHLGKSITYAAGKSADVIIWIVQRARDEHRQAVEWLNQRTDENVGFFLIEIQLWRIGDSLPAPKFHIVEQPNNWAKAMKAVGGLTETKKLQLEFWQAFNDYAFSNPTFTSHFSQRKPQAQHWYDMSVGNSDYRISLTVNTQKNRLGAELYISGNKELFAKFASQKDAISSFLDMSVEWREGKKDCRILTSKDGSIKDGADKWVIAFDWFMETAIKIKKMAKTFDV
ncbi:MAG: DUF4268 domain-containing protein [Oscillospiraceae bacterium]|nr:DUF4268 domain-containing protein [Oscillospiraceae bacterium]